VKGFHLPELDGLRGFAALGAVLFHYLVGPSMRSSLAGGIRSALEFGPFSVDTFFVLSGFLIGGILLRARESPNYYRTFYVRRAYRILPLYYLWITVCLAFLFFAPGWGVAITGYRFPFVAASFLLFFHNFVPTIVRSSFIASPMWTLAVEEHFYLVAPAMARKLGKRRLMQLLVGVLVFTPLLRGFLFKVVGHGSDWSMYANYMCTFCRVDALAMGMLLAVLWASPELRAKVKERSSWLLPGLVALTVAGWTGQLLNEHHVPYTYTVVAAFGRTSTELACAALLMLILSRPEGAINRWLRSSFMRKMGKISYCLYLVHWGVLWMMTRFVFHTRFGQSLVLDLALASAAFVLSIAIAKLSLRYIEEPLIRRGHRYSY
jgi:peptidoglycan/LPS O-acetylase OafA/YrhL